MWRHLKIIFLENHEGIEEVDRIEAPDHPQFLCNSWSFKRDCA